MRCSVPRPFRTCVIVALDSPMWAAMVAMVGCPERAPAVGRLRVKIGVAFCIRLLFRDSTIITCRAECCQQMCFSFVRGALPGRNGGERRRGGDRFVGAPGRGYRAVLCRE